MDSINLAKTLYCNEIPTSDKICSNLLLRAAQYLVFYYVYENVPECVCPIPPVCECLFECDCPPFRCNCGRETPIPVANLKVLAAHRLFLKDRYCAFQNAFSVVQSKVESIVLRDIGNDDPTIKLFSYIFDLDELHIRQPKISVVRSQELRDQHTYAIKDVYNPITKEIVDFSDAPQKKLMTLIFIPPNYEDNDVQDTQDRFCTVLSKRWGKLAKFLHNVFHFMEYVNLSMNHAVLDRLSVMRTKTWEENWTFLVGKEYADEDIKNFKVKTENNFHVKYLRKLLGIVEGACLFIKKYDKPFDGLGGRANDGRDTRRQGQKRKKENREKNTIGKPRFKKGRSKTIIDQKKT